MVGARAQLRVFSAGVWHNLVLGAGAWLASLALPTILSPLYFTALSGGVVLSCPEYFTNGCLFSG